MSETSRTNHDKRPTVLCILDGWGCRVERENNAIALGETPNWDRMIEAWPTALLECAGENVGLPDGQMGNSEVGHMNLGAGRAVWQNLPRINNAIADGSFANATALASFIEALMISGGTCHLAGLVSTGGVHSHQNHIVALAELVAKAGIPVKIHVFLDGRDTPPKSATDYVAQLAQAIDGLPDVHIATVCGRYFAMDRDKRWERVELAYDLIVSGIGGVFDDPVAAIHASYDVGVSDEFLQPAHAREYRGMADGDGIIHANFLADRVRELLGALVDPAFDGFARKHVVSWAAALGMVAYLDQPYLYCPVIFPSVYLKNTLGEVVSHAGLRQLRMAETEKYAHVTFFFNGRREQPLEGEERVFLPSPKVATYDLQPEMSAPELTSQLVNAIGSGRFDLIVVNYANGDMVGHTGILEAAIAAVQCVDECIGQVGEAVIEAGGVMLVTADHGNCEMMVDPETGEPHTAHTLSAVPAVLVNCTLPGASLADGRLADVAPTLIELMGLTQPVEMTGHSLIKREGAPTLLARRCY
jgi:2,3-bisphosphoglycerate-independent phosphoglycerate mutase